MQIRKHASTTLEELFRKCRRLYLSYTILYKAVNKLKDKDRREELTEEQCEELYKLNTIASKKLDEAQRVLSDINKLYKKYN